MNPRIKELAEQAGYSKDYLEIGLPSNMEKFAELIVRECAELCDINDKEQGNILREHFGVGE
jgi:hypothetical protein